MLKFNKHEKESLNALIDLIDSSLDRVKTSLKLYDSFIGMYRTLE
jgi:hypothetical protein